MKEMIHIINTVEVDDKVILIYSNGETIKVKKEDWVRATGAIINADYDAVARDFGINIEIN